jgi:hypothetical protein
MHALISCTYTIVLFISSMVYSIHAWLVQPRVELEFLHAPFLPGIVLTAVVSWLALLGVAKIATLVLVADFQNMAAGAKLRSWRTAKTFVAGNPPSKR